ncbi:hypothetical protein [Alicyclobacillus sp. ALC3]|uniref:hypothetical protein n=1 Tax=Alicyclobacillus sp. ALC3 TaxID=2796143 RepID=UPI002377EE73|nr:hypothetical protein [Alicyclobacillus sp. ALC3]WDL96961.1 hypothetical protein JC200_22225 [Alicyclobacillus sp. ALC3]
MPWKCRMVEYDPAMKLEIGDMFFANEYLQNSVSLKHLSAHYLAEPAGRPPLWVMTPGGCWCVDERPFVRGEWTDGGWKVTGTAPNITARPSINFPGLYHGWLTDGVLSDDLEGRRYD